MTTQTLPSTPAKIPLSERFNIRLIIFFGVIGLMIGYPVYWFVHEQLTGGISDAGGGYKEVDLKAMSNFMFDQNAGTIEDVPKKWRELDGQRIVVYGEMWQPTGAGATVQNFDLVYSIAKCCVSTAPQIQHFVHSSVKDKKDIAYYSGLVRVKGVLHVNVTREENRVTGVYQLEVESVEPA